MEGVEEVSPPFEGGVSRHRCVGTGWLIYSF